MNYLIITPAEEMLSETMGDGGSDFKDFWDVFATDHHVSVVELHINIRLFIQEIISATCWSQTHQLPKITMQLMTARSLAKQQNNKIVTVFNAYSVFSQFNE